MSNPTQLFLLADHIKLSLLERQRAIALNLEPNSQDAHISRSLESLREGVDDLSSSSPESDQLATIRNQYHDLSRQFHGDNPPSTSAATLTSPNDPTLAQDFSSAQTIPPNAAAAKRSSASHASSLKPSSSPRTKGDPTKSVRFRDSPSSTSLDSQTENDNADRNALFPARYRDNADDESHPGEPDPSSQMTNQQIHVYHTQVLQEQDSQLDDLAHSIGRQRHLSMQIGDELEGQIALLDEVDEGVDRHQSRLDVAKRRLNGVSKRARQNWGMTTIIVLIVILVLLIVILK